VSEVKMLFRIIGPHQHQAMAGGSTFSCTRQRTPTDAGFSISWSAGQDRAVLKNDCRTLNEAKKVCRAAAVRTPASGAGRPQSAGSKSL